MTDKLISDAKTRSPESMQHIAIEVKSMEKSLDFYKKILGMKLTEQHEAKEIKNIPVALCFLRLATSTNHHDLVLVHDPNKTYQEKKDCLSPNFHHMAFSFKNEKAWQNKLEHIKKMGVSIVRGPVLHSPFQPGGEGSWGENKSFYILDPDGHRIEFFCDMASIDEKGYYRDQDNKIIAADARATEI